MNPFKKELIEKINIKSDAIVNAFERVIDELAPSQANEAEKLKSVLDAIEKKDYNEYKESKRIIKNNVLSGFTGAIVTAIIAIIGFVITKMQGGI